MNNVWNCSIAICAFNRPEYLSKCLEYLFKTPDIFDNKIPVYVFCDGGIESTQEKNREIISYYPLITETFYQNENLCIPKHIHYLRETIFDKMGYDRLMFLEEDVLISPYYYRFMNGVLDYYEKIDSTVGMVNSCLVNTDTLEEKINKWNYFIDMGSNINNYIMLKNTWDVIKPIMQEYLNKFIIPSTSYNKVNFTEVINWAKDKLINSKFSEMSNKVDINGLCGSQDSISNVAMRINNIRYVSSYINRVINIGEHGYWSNSDIYKQGRFGMTKLDIMSEDINNVITVIENI